MTWLINTKSQTGNSGCLNRGISGIVSFRHDMVLSVLFQYTTPVNNIQNNSFSGPLYFVTFEKTFAKRLKTGIVCGLPLTGSFTYNGSEIEKSGIFQLLQRDYGFTRYPG